MCRLKVFVVLLSLSMTLVAYSDVIHVPDDQPTIQAGINAASTGDTVSVAPGIYFERIRFNGKAITVRSEGGPNQTTINGSWSGSVVTFADNETIDSVITGFTIKSGSGTYSIGYYLGGGIYCNNSSPLIASNVITGNSGWGAGIACENASPIISGNLMTNSTSGNGGGIYCYQSSPEIYNNIIAYNTTEYSGGIACQQSTPIIASNTIVYNSATNNSGGISCYNESSIIIIDTILYGNVAPAGHQLYLSSPPATVTISYSDVDGGQSAVYVTPGCTLNWGAGMIDVDPLLVTGQRGDYYLSQEDAGQIFTSVCVDAGSAPADDICFVGVDSNGNPGILCMGSATTRTDHVADEGQVDMGYHYIVQIPSLSADLTCEPSLGVLPLVTQMEISFENLTEAYRRFAGHLDADLAGGQHYTNWRAGYTNVTPGDVFTRSWNQNIPNLGTLVGDNLFTLVAADVTPPPYNQPPYPSAGFTDTASCTVTGIAP